MPSRTAHRFRLPCGRHYCDVLVVIFPFPSFLLWNSPMEELSFLPHLSNTCLRCCGYSFSSHRVGSGTGGPASLLIAQPWLWGDPRLATTPLLSPPPPDFLALQELQAHLMTSLPQPSLQLFPQGPWFLVAENSVRHRGLGVGCACRWWGGTASLPCSGQSQEVCEHLEHTTDKP